MVDQVPAPVVPVVAAPDPKKPWESKTIVIAAIVGILTSIVPFFPGLSAFQDWINSNGVLIGAGWSVLAIVLRSVTKDAVSLQD
jgi:hypothetical protein